MSFRGRDDSGGNPNKIEIDDARRFGRSDNDKPGREDTDGHMSRFDSGRGRRPPFGRGRRSPPGRDKFGGRSRDFGYGRDEPPPMRDRSPMHGPDDRFKKDDGFSKRDDHRKDMGRYDDPRDRFMGMEGRPRFDGPENFNSRFDGPSDQFKNRPTNFPPKGYFNEGFPKPNECEIIVVNKLQRAYAESVEARVKNLGILVDILFLKDEALLTQTIDDIARRGSLYAMVISPQNETHGSVTVNILHGTPQEHRNMPLDDALKLISRNFHDYIRIQKENMERERAERGPYIGNVAADREIQFLLRMLADGRWISLAEINTVIHYLCERRDKMQSQGEDRPPGRPPMPAGDMKIEPPFKPKDDIDVAQKEQDLQNRIMNIMNQGAPPAGLGSAPPNMNERLISTMDRSNPPGLSSGSGNIRPQLGTSPNLTGMKSVKPGLDDTSSSAQNFETSLSESSNQAVFTSTVSGSSMPSDSAAPTTYINFDNPSVQKALDNLMQSGPSLLKSIGLPGNAGLSNPSQNVTPPKSTPSSIPGIGGSSEHLGISSMASRGNMGPPPQRGSSGMSDMNISQSRNPGNFDMPPRSSGGMGDISGSSLPVSGNLPDLSGSQRGGFGSTSGGGMNSSHNFGGGNINEGGRGPQRMPSGMPDMGRMGPQRAGGPPMGQDIGRGPSPSMGAGGNFGGQSQFGKFGPGQQGNFPGSYNNPSNMGRQNYGGPQNMGGGPRRY